MRVRHTSRWQRANACVLANASLLKCYRRRHQKRYDAFYFGEKWVMKAMTVPPRSRLSRGRAGQQAARGMTAALVDGRDSDRLRALTDKYAHGVWCYVVRLNGGDRVKAQD